MDQRLTCKVPAFMCLCAYHIMVWIFLVYFLDFVVSANTINMSTDTNTDELLK